MLEIKSDAPGLELSTKTSESRFSIVSVFCALENLRLLEIPESKLLDVLDNSHGKLCSFKIYVTENIRDQLHSIQVNSTVRTCRRCTCSSRRSTSATWSSSSCCWTRSSKRPSTRCLERTSSTTFYSWVLPRIPLIHHPEPPCLRLRADRLADTCLWILQRKSRTRRTLSCEIMRMCRQSHARTLIRTLNRGSRVAAGLTWILLPNGSLHMSTTTNSKTWEILVFFQFFSFIGTRVERFGKISARDAVRLWDQGGFSCSCEIYLHS